MEEGGIEMEINNELKIGNSTTSFGDILSTLDILKRMFNFETKEFGGATWLKIVEMELCFEQCQSFKLVFQDINGLF